MMRGINGINTGIYPLGKGPARPSRAVPGDGSAAFEKALEEAKNRLDVKLSKHAQLRMQDRNILLDKNQIERLNTAVKKAREKGIKDTLVLMDDKVFVINVKNTTVITAADSDSIKEKVFTNIDGAVIV